MADVSKVKVEGTSYDIVSKTGRGLVRATMSDTSAATAFVISADGITSLYDGLTIVCKNIKIASAANCTLNLNNLGAKRIWLSQSNAYCTTHWGLNNTYIFIYDATNSRWELQQGRDTNSNTNVTQTATTTSANYEVLFSYTADNTTRTEGARKSDGLKFNPATKNLIGNKARFANTGYGVSFSRTTATPVETIIKTGIKWVSSAHMPVVHVTGYAYGLKSPVEFKIGFYIYSDKLTQQGAVNMGSWSPDIYLFKYERESVNYVAIAFVGSCYFLQLQIDVQDEMGKFANIDVSDSAWSWEFLTTTGNVPEPDDGVTCIQVPYKANILNPSKVNGHTVASNVPANAVFTDTQSDWNVTDTSSKAYIKNKPTTLGTVTTVKVGSTSYSPTSGVVSLPAYPSVPITAIQQDGTPLTPSSGTVNIQVGLNKDEYGPNASQRILARGNVFVPVFTTNPEANVAPNWGYNGLVCVKIGTPTDILKDIPTGVTWSNFAYLRMMNMSVLSATVSWTESAHSTSLIIGYIYDNHISPSSNYAYTDYPMKAVTTLVQRDNGSGANRDTARIIISDTDGSIRVAPNGSTATAFANYHRVQFSISYVNQQAYGPNDERWYNEAP